MSAVVGLQIRRRAKRIGTGMVSFPFCTVLVCDFLYLLACSIWLSTFQTFISSVKSVCLWFIRFGFFDCDFCTFDTHRHNVNDLYLQKSGGRWRPQQRTWSSDNRNRKALHMETCWCPLYSFTLYFRKG